MKKLYIVLVVLVLVIIVAVAYLLFFRAPQAPAGTAATGTSTGSLPSVTGTGSGSQNGNGGTATGAGALPAGGAASSTSFGTVSDEPVLDYFVDARNNATVVEPDGTIVAVSGGATSSLSSAPIQNMVGAGFSHDGTKLFVSFGNPQNPQTSIFTVATKAWAPQPLGMRSPAWSPSDSRLAYLQSNADGSATLATLDTSKPSAKPVALITLHAQDLSLNWINPNQIVLSDRPSAYEQGTALIYNLAQKTLMEPFVPAYGFEAAWSNATNTAALTFTSSAATRGGSLALSLPGLTTQQNLTIVTLPSKCAFYYETPTVPAPTIPTSTAGSTSTKGAFAAPAKAAVPQPVLVLFCGIPQDPNALTNAALPDAYEQKTLFTSDGLYEVNTQSGNITALIVPAPAVDATDLRVVGPTLFFVNRYNHKLYALSLGS